MAATAAMPERLPGQAWFVGLILTSLPPLVLLPGATHGGSSDALVGVLLWIGFLVSLGTPVVAGLWSRVQPAQRETLIGAAAGLNLVAWSLFGALLA